MLEELDRLKYIFQQVTSSNPDDPYKRESMIIDGFIIIDRLSRKVVSIIEDLY